MSSSTPQTVILDALNIMGYQDSKDEAVGKIMRLALLKGLGGSIDSLSGETREQLDNGLKTAQSLEEVKSLVEKYVGMDEYIKLTAKGLIDVLGECIKGAWPVLSSDQKKKLTAYFANFKS